MPMTDEELSEQGQRFIREFPKTDLEGTRGERWALCLLQKIAEGCSR